MIDIFLLFILYSFLGWIMEVIDTKITTGNWVNRGFLMGPICPIYGIASIIMTYTLNYFYSHPLLVFIMALLICSIVEYLTSLIMEKIFKMRWWDYSNKKFNINGRICLQTMLIFGTLGTLMIYLFNPTINNLLAYLGESIKEAVTIIIAIIFIVDFLVSTNIIFNIKSITKNLKKDSTEEIVKATKKAVEKHLVLYKRLINAFPNAKKILKNKKHKKK